MRRGSGGGGIGREWYGAHLDNNSITPTASGKKNQRLRLGEVTRGMGDLKNWWERSRTSALWVIREMRSLPCRGENEYSGYTGRGNITQETKAESKTLLLLGLSIDCRITHILGLRKDSVAWVGKKGPGLTGKGGWLSDENEWAM